MTQSIEQFELPAQASPVDGLAKQNQEAFNAYLVARSLDDTKPWDNVTMTGYQSAFNSMARSLAALGIDAPHATARELKEWARVMEHGGPARTDKLSLYTISRYLNHLHHFYTWLAMASKTLRNNAALSVLGKGEAASAEGLIYRREPRTNLPVVFTAHERERIDQWIANALTSDDWLKCRDAAMLAMHLYAFLRPGQCLELRLTQLAGDAVEVANWQRHPTRLSLPPQGTLRGKAEAEPLEVTLNRPARAALHRWLAIRRANPHPDFKPAGGFVFMARPSIDKPLERYVWHERWEVLRAQLLLGEGNPEDSPEDKSKDSPKGKNAQIQFLRYSGIARELALAHERGTALGAVFAQAGLVDVKSQATYKELVAQVGLTAFERQLLAPDAPQFTSILAGT